jgi:hypothetical protein
MKKHHQVLFAVALAAPLITGVLWLGAGQGEAGRGLPAAAGATSAAATVTSPTPVAAVRPAGAATPLAPAAAPLPPPVALTPERRRFILGEFVKAAETDIARVESGLAEARQGGAPAEDIAAREAQLRTMKQVLQRALERNAGV